MQRIYKFSLYLLATLLLITLVAPPKTQAVVINVQCAALGAKRKIVAENMKPKVADLENVRVKNRFALPQAKNVAQDEIDATRKAADKKRQDLYKKLDAKLQKVKQKTAFFTYQKEVKVSITAHRKSNDAARDKFDAQMKQLFADHRKAVDAGFSALNKNYDRNFQDAVALCQKMGVEKATTQLKADIATSEKRFVQAPNILPSDLEVLTNIYSDTQQASNDADDKKFQAALQASRVKFGKAFDFARDTKNIFEPSK